MGKRGRASNEAFDENEVLGDGFNLSREQVKKIESELFRDPSSLRMRLLLLGFYGRGGCCRDAEENQEAFLEHLIWMIDNYPGSKILSHTQPFAYNNRSFSKVKWHWLRAIKLSPHNVRVLNNAAHCCILPAPKLAEKLWRRARQIEPQNEEWPRELSHLYKLSANNPKARKDRIQAKKSIEEGKRALELHKEFPKSSYLETYMVMTVQELAELALKFDLDDATKYFGEYLRDRGRRRRPSKKARHSRFEEHMGHSILGRCASKSGDTERAKMHLSKMPNLGDPYWRHDLILARVVLEAGEKGAVVEYLDGCAQNISEELKRTANKTVTEQQVPAWLSIEHESYDESIDFNEFVRMRLEWKIEQITKWRNIIHRGRMAKLETFI